jgi:hypothetical protein
MKLTLTLVAILCGTPALAQTPSAPKPEPDVLIFTDGEKLIGHLKRADGASVTFKSDMAGEVTVDWSKIKELHTSEQFAVIPKDVQITRHPDTSKIPQGTVSMAEQKLEVHPEGGGAAQTVTVAETGHVIDGPGFTAALHPAGYLHDWKGSITGGAALVEATQTNQTFTGGFNLVRAAPGQDWLSPRNRTLVDFNAAYGKVTQPNTPSVKTEIYHAHAERDEYFNQNVFAFGQAAFDHNFSQGLDLSQTYGGGIGWTVIRDDAQELDLKGSMTYIQQSFAGPTVSQNLIGSTFGENYNRKFNRGILVAEQLTLTPAWNNTNAYSGVGSVSLTVPFYKRLNVGSALVDNFLNDPPPGFKKNSFQFTLGLTYTLP